MSTDKHSMKKNISSQLEQKLASSVKDNKISCAQAYRISDELNMLYSDMGSQLDQLEIRLTTCQLGLFGYGPEKKRFDPDIEVTEKMKILIQKNQTDQCMSCSKCWKLAESLSISRLEMGSVCEKLGIRIKPCQLGAF